MARSGNIKLHYDVDYELWLYNDLNDITPDPALPIKLSDGTHYARLGSSSDPGATKFAVKKDGIDYYIINKEPDIEVPIGTVMMFATSCPPGWSDIGTLGWNDKMLRANNNESTGGNSNHSHYTVWDVTGRYGNSSSGSSPQQTTDTAPQNSIDFGGPASTGDVGGYPVFTVASGGTFATYEQEYYMFNSGTTNANHNHLTTNMTSASRITDSGEFLPRYININLCEKVS